MPAEDLPRRQATASSVRAGVLELRDVTKRYSPDRPPAVDGLSLTVPAGEVCVLIGPSGCGKTTALKMINRLIEPTAGEILIDGHGVRRRNAAELRREVGYVIQQVGLLPHLTVAGNVGTVPRLLGWDRRRIAERTRELLELVGLPLDEFGARYPAQLSGGQQQRVGLARALAADPPVMLMDEPFSAVDPITRERLQRDFLSLHRAVPKTVVLVSHDIDEAVRMADRIAVMRAGRLVQYATPAELLADPADDFVAGFVGADRALKSLSLTRVEDIALTPAPIAVAGEPVPAVHERLARDRLAAVDGRVLVCDREGRPLGWRGLAGLNGTVPTPAGGAGPVVDNLATLRDALSALLGAGVDQAPVVDARGACVGLVGVEQISGAVRRPRTGADGG